MGSPLTEYYADRYVATLERSAGTSTLRFDLRYDDLAGFVASGAPGFEVVVLGIAKRAREQIGFLGRPGHERLDLEAFGFFAPDHPLRQALRRRAPEEQRGAFAFYRLPRP